MNRLLERVVFIRGRGREPAVQAEFADTWQSRYGLEVVHAPIDWRDHDYTDQLATIGRQILSLAKEGNVSIMGASAGGKAALSLFVDHPDTIHRVVVINTKIPPYESTATWLDAYPSIKKSSVRLQKDLGKLTTEMRARILCARSETDETMEPDTSVLWLPEAHRYDLENIHGHVEGIKHALTDGCEPVVEFIKQEEVEYPVAV